MLFKRIIEGKSVLNAENKKAPEKCFRRNSECDGCWEHSTILEEMTKMVFLGVVLWAGVTLGSQLTPYPLNLIITTDIIHPPPMYDFPFPSPENLKRLPPVTVAHTNTSINFSKFTVNMMERFEENLKGSGITAKQGSVAQGVAIQGKPSEDARHYDKSSLIITKASQNLVWKKCAIFGLEKDECASFISTLNLRESEFGGECASLERFTCRTNKMSSKYRTFDGSCNNPVRSSWGQALTGYKRILHPRYFDGIEEPRRAASNHALPSGRLVSTSLANNLDKPSEEKTIAMAIWGQFVQHDLTHTPVRKTLFTDQTIRCCANNGMDLAPRYIHTSCLPISVPDNDPYYKDKYVSCMEYTRSATTYRGDCTFGAAEQMNQATHFLDGSHIYGANGRDAAALRETSGGLLKTSTVEGEVRLSKVAKPMETCLVGSDEDACFLAGDARANANPWLAGIHTLFAMEHNRIARSLAVLNPGWSSDKLYHEARRIVVATLQHITYKQWLPALTGKSFDELYDSYDTGYNSDVDPSVTNAFATAAFHFTHSMLDQDVALMDDQLAATFLRLNDSFFNPNLLMEKHGLVKLLRGMVNQKAQDLDLNYDDDVRHRWLGGLDALAFDIQRGRDHGLPPYAHYRSLCGLQTASSFGQLADVIPQELVDKLSKIYESAADVDLVVGLMAETPLPGSLLGPTATCLFKEQMWRTRVGDRYFYEHSSEAGGAPRRQTAELRKASLAALLCHNTDIGSVQRDVFRAVSESNPIVSCDKIKRINLEAWQDSQSPDILTRTTKWLRGNRANTENVTK